MVWCFHDPYLIDRNFYIYYCLHCCSSRDIDGICEPISRSLLYGNNIISGTIIPTSAAIDFHFYPIWEATSVDEWLYNGGPYELIVPHFLLGAACYMGCERELSFYLGIRHWIAVAYLALATIVFFIYPIGPG
ncbi:partial [Olea europaea subsp. europaea]|uniref:Partial (Plastid) n=1 Tax=Olea europaea subsp. europaea TaxID=158383 RepID=A0A8S0VNP3_OLEEU|nr:partial [Olea europaea subsp. europaea]